MATSTVAGTPRADGADHTGGGRLDGAGDAAGGRGETASEEAAAPRLNAALCPLPYRAFLHGVAVPLNIAVAMPPPTFG